MLLIIVVYFISTTTVASSSPSISDLAKRLLSLHNPFVLPMNNITIGIGGSIYQILDMDGAHQQFTALMWMRYSWFDNTLSWNQEQFNFTRIWLPAERIWKPNIVVYNTIHYTDLIKSSTSYVKIDSSGKVVHSFPMIYTASCKFDITKFPFDKQKCSMQVGSWGMDATQTNLAIQSDVINTDNYIPNNQWELKKRFYAEYDTDPPNPKIGYVNVQYVFNLRRLPMFYVINLVIPSAIITSVALMGIFTPTQSDGIRIEKVSMGLTTMLTMAVFLLMISDQTPKDSTTIPILSLYILLEIAIVTLSTLVSIVLMHLQVRDLKKKPVSIMWKKMIGRLSNKPKKCDVNKHNEVIHESHPNNDKTSSCRDPSVSVGKTEKVHEKLRHVHSTLSWEDVCYVLDNVALRVSFGLFLAITVALVCILPAL